jgi:ubiquinol-cytochrome c reductase cytochrome b subunit
VAEYKTIAADAPRTQRFMNWIDNRFPATQLWNEHVGQYYAPKNFNVWYIFGSLSLFVLVLQIVTGIFLVMHYKPDAQLAFASVEYIMRDVPLGWVIRYMHSTGASAFFIVVYLHMFRGLLYGSYRKPRELVWIFGCLIFLSLMAEAFMGYLLPWGQMSFWGAQVIVNLFSAIPFVGPDLAQLIRGDYVVSDATLNRFFSFHVIAVPLVLLGLVAAHIVALHEVGSNNPDGVEIKAKKDKDGHPLDGIPFHPYYTTHDILGVSIFLMIFSAIMFFAPEFGGYFLEPNNFIPFFLPWLDHSPVKSIRYRPGWHRGVLGVFVLFFLVLGYLGSEPPSVVGNYISQLGTLVYFGFFLLMPWWSALGTFKPVPDRVTYKPH